MNINKVKVIAIKWKLELVLLDYTLIIEQHRIFEDCTKIWINKSIKTCSGL